jgi:hypothetical protein
MIHVGGPNAALQGEIQRELRDRLSRDDRAAAEQQASFKFAASDADDANRLLQAWKPRCWRRRCGTPRRRLAQKDDLLKEWMHSNEAFKRLARKYGKKLGVSDEQRQMDV